MNTLEQLNDEQLSNVILRAVKFNLDNDFIIYLKNEAVRRILYGPEDNFKIQLQESLNFISFKKELELLYKEQSRCKDPTIREQITSDIFLLESVISTATELIK